MTRSTREKYRSCLSLLLFSFACCPDMSTWRYHHHHMLEGVKTKCSTCLPTHPSLRLLSFSSQGLHSILLQEFGTYWGLPPGARAFTGPDTSAFSSFPWALGPRLTFLSWFMLSFENMEGASPASPPHLPWVTHRPGNKGSYSSHGSCLSF